MAESQLYPQESQYSPDQTHAAVVYPVDEGNWVFNAGTIWWSEGLSQAPGHIPARTQIGGALGVHPEVQRITANVLNRMIQDFPRLR